jgi:hypothetical protein
MCNMKSAASRTWHTTLRWLILLMLHDGTCTSSAIELSELCAIQMIVLGIESNEGKGGDKKFWRRSESRGFEEVGCGDSEEDRGCFEERG